MNLSGRYAAFVLGAVISATLLSSAQTAVWSQKVVSAEPMVAPRLRYRLIDQFGPVRFCDPDCMGPCNLLREKKNAEEAFPLIRKDAETFRAITEHLGLEALHEFSAEQRLSIYREYKNLSRGVSLEIEGKSQRFKIAEGNGFRVEGVVSPQGEITVREKTPARVFCPL